MSRGVRGYNLNVFSETLLQRALKDMWLGSMLYWELHRELRPSLQMLPRQRTFRTFRRVWRYHTRAVRAQRAVAARLSLRVRLAVLCVLAPLPTR